MKPTICEMHYFVPALDPRWMRCKCGVIIRADMHGRTIQPREATPRLVIDSDINPCVTMFGNGPSGAYCAQCIHLRRTPETAGVYRKCDLRKNTRGKATDHRATWSACARYEETK